ncbi:MAG: purine-binding chemotaxis protein CheW [Gemmatimonadota bacterium]|nr:MAG: purine-binding chemotaxis protein CheW [Gemmatimonadota bacterium]
MNVGDEVQLVTFRIGDHEFAFSVFQVERILRYAAPNPVPQAPDYLEGTIRYGDEVVPVVDLRKRFETEAPIGDETRVVVIALEGGRIGVVVDAVLEVLKVSAEDVAPPPSMVQGLAAEFISGILTRGDRTLLVLAVPKLLSSEERIALDALTAEIAHE